MDLNLIKDSIKTNVYYIQPDGKVPLHSHKGQDEIFYCIKGSGFGILEDREESLEAGDSFVVRADRLHSLRSDEGMYVVATLVPVNHHKR